MGSGTESVAEVVGAIGEVRCITFEVVGSFTLEVLAGLSADIAVFGMGSSEEVEAIPGSGAVERTAAAGHTTAKEYKALPSPAAAGHTHSGLLDRSPRRANHLDLAG